MLYLISKNQTKSEDEASNNIFDILISYNSLHKYQKTAYGTLKFVPTYTDKH